MGHGGVGCVELWSMQGPLVTWDKTIEPEVSANIDVLAVTHVESGNAHELHPDVLYKLRTLRLQFCYIAYTAIIDDSLEAG